MDKYAGILENLLLMKEEYEWLDFKENWFSKDEIGEYISAISNGAAICGKEYGYIVWGVSNENKEVVGTTVRFDVDIDGEPYKHYLSRKLSPHLPFETIDLVFKGKKVLLLVIPAARGVKTTFGKIAYIRIGSSKEKLERFPEWETKLHNVVSNGVPTIVNTPSPDYAQDLTFEKLFMYYGAKGIALRADTFEKTLRLRTKNGDYNLMAYILSDQNSIPIRVSVFSGTDKAAPLFSVKEYGNTCILYSLEKILDYGDAINIIQADERNRIVERKEVALFNADVFREAVLNAFVHNKWLTLNGPAITVLRDRLEILSHGGLAADQDEQGFYQGSSVPVNDVLASIFLQLRISERSGRGVPKIVGCYGKEAITIEKNTIIVRIPFKKIEAVPFEIVPAVSKKVSNKMNETQRKMVEIIRDNPNVTIYQLGAILGLSDPAVKKNLRRLKDEGTIRRVGSRKRGYWYVQE